MKVNAGSVLSGHSLDFSLVPFSAIKSIFAFAFAIVGIVTISGTST